MPFKLKVIQYDFNEFLAYKLFPQSVKVLLFVLLSLKNPKGGENGNYNV